MLRCNGVHRRVLREPEWTSSRAGILGRAQAKRSRPSCDSRAWSGEVAGPPLPPRATLEVIGSGLFELRHVGKLNTRVLWFFMKGRRIVAVHGIRKIGRASCR